MKFSLAPPFNFFFRSTSNYPNVIHRYFVKINNHENYTIIPLSLNLTTIYTWLVIDE